MCSSWKHRAGRLLGATDHVGGPIGHLYAAFHDQTDHHPQKCLQPAHIAPNVAMCRKDFPQAIIEGSSSASLSVLCFLLFARGIYVDRYTLKFCQSMSICTKKSASRSCGCVGMRCGCCAAGIVLPRWSRWWGCMSAVCVVGSRGIGKGVLRKYVDIGEVGDRDNRRN